MHSHPWQPQQEFLGTTLGAMHHMQEHLLARLQQLHETPPPSFVTKFGLSREILLSDIELNGGTTEKRMKEKERLPSSRLVEEEIDYIQQQIIEDRMTIEHVLQASVTQWNKQLMPKEAMETLHAEMTQVLDHLHEQGNATSSYAHHIHPNTELELDTQAGITVLQHHIAMARIYTDMARKLSVNPQRANQPRSPRDHAALKQCFDHWRGTQRELDKMANFAGFIHHAHPVQDKDYETKIQEWQHARDRNAFFLETVLNRLSPPEIQVMEETLYTQLHQELKREQKEIALLQQCLNEVQQKPELQDQEVKRFTIRTTLQALAGYHQEIKRLHKTVSRFVSSRER